jgi:hypothetical protein
MVSPTTIREVLYVIMTRGRVANHVYVDTFFDPNPDTSHGPAPEQDVRDVLAGVLNNLGADLSATAMREMLEEKERALPRQAAIYTELARIGERNQRRALLTQAGLGAEQIDAVLTSDAWGALSTTLRTADAHGLPIADVMRAIVRERGFHDAVDIASVLHKRLDNWIARHAQGLPAPAAARVVAGLLPRVQPTGDAVLDLAASQQADRIVETARRRVATAAAEGRRWLQDLGEPPRDSSRREAWERCAITVAAYYGLTGLHSLSPELARNDSERILNTLANQARLSARDLSAADLAARQTTGTPTVGVDVPVLPIDPSAGRGV